MSTIVTELRKKGATADTVAKALAEVNGGTGSTIAEVLSSGDVEAYIVSFDANGGSGTVAPVACSNGATVTLPDGTGLTPPSSKQFKGWGTSSDATSVITTIAATEDTTLYAIWEDE